MKPTDEQRRRVIDKINGRTPPTLASELEQAQARVRELEKRFNHSLHFWTQEYEGLSREKLVGECIARAVCREAQMHELDEVKDALAASQADAARLREALQIIHTQAHCISKAGPLSTPTFAEAWHKFDMLAALATKALSNTQPGDGA